MAAFVAMATVLPESFGTLTLALLFVVRCSVNWNNCNRTTACLYACKSVYLYRLSAYQSGQCTHTHTSCMLRELEMEMATHQWFGTQRTIGARFSNQNSCSVHSTARSARLRANVHVQVNLACLAKISHRVSMLQRNATQRSTFTSVRRTHELNSRLITLA